ncbi:MAG TPA: tripartite tricarboxylate transporter substrate-binding protein [Burkholderiales bacterium]|nr:tripartite tricarboxylate transporter substrate-binding protein [Burkholderiales bacterium]
MCSPNPQPVQIAGGVGGHGSTGQVVAEMLKELARIDIRHVPYRGAAHAVVDLVGGHIEAVSVTLTTVSPQIHVGKACALAMSSPSRVADYPDVPTFSESGYPQLVASVWFSLSGPACMPPEIVNRLNAEVRRILQLPDVRQRLRADAIEPGTLDAKTFTAFVAAGLARWTPIVRKAGGPGR